MLPLLFLLSSFTFFIFSISHFLNFQCSQFSWYFSSSYFSYFPYFQFFLIFSNCISFTFLVLWAFRSECQPPDLVHSQPNLTLYSSQDPTNYWWISAFPLLPTISHSPLGLLYHIITFSWWSFISRRIQTFHGTYTDSSFLHAAILRTQVLLCYKIYIEKWVLTKSSSPDRSNPSQKH